MGQAMEFYPLRVADVTRLCEDAVAVTFDVPSELATTFAFRPGQALTLRHDRAETDGALEERRSYSICAPPGQRPRIGVRKVPGGSFSSWLVDDVRPGTSVEVAPPTGSFCPDASPGGRHVLIAAGSGITPMLSIASALLHDTDARVTLLYGNRRTDTVMFAEDLADLKDSYPDRFELIHLLSREPRESELLSGRLDATKLRELIPALVPVDHNTNWWLCGPYGMIVDAQTVLSEVGVRRQRVHHELFYVEDTAPPPAQHVEPAEAGPRVQLTVQLDGRATKMAVPSDVPILDAAQRIRSDLPFACKGGVCGTCRAKVVSGEVRMRRNFALEQEELDRGFVLTCQSLPVTEHLTVDYDS